MNALLLLSLALPADAAVTLKTLKIPGTPAFVAVAKDILDVRFAMDPSAAAGDGLFDDAARAPSFSPEAVAALVKRLDADLAALPAMPWRAWDVDRQIDWRLMYASAEEAGRQLSVERLYTHRPASWLEPLANDYIALVTYAPERADIRKRLTAQIPAMTAEMRKVCVSPTARDVTTAEGVTKGIFALLKTEPASPERDAAVAALTDYMDGLKKLTGLPESAVIGRDNYAWRVRRANLLPWTPQQLLALAQRELTETDAAMADLKSRVSTAPVPSDAERVLAANLTQESLLGLYDDIVREDRAFLEKSDVLSVPKEVGPIRARPTPDAMVPLTGDGGSMNPPPTIGESNTGWWNVEHFKPEWTPEKRLEMVVGAREHHLTDMGPYAVHEGVPGHHLQLSVARLNPDPLRSLLWDNAMGEGWALYAESIFWAAGGLGSSPEAESQTLDSWRYRIRRVFYDVNVESGDWSLQDAGDFKSLARKGKGHVDEDILRTINWPAQLIGYFSGKLQIQALREDYKRKLGAAYSDRKFHDALLAEGSIPLALIRAKLLGEPVPGID